MNQNVIRCNCGHRVLGREVLRTEFYERRAPDSDSIREYVYVKYRCKRCKRMGEKFLSESRWDWKMLEPERNEMNDIERDFFLDEEPLSTQDVLELHHQLEGVSIWSDLANSVKSPTAKDAASSSTLETDATTNEAAPAKDERPTSSTRMTRSDSRTGDSRPGDSRPGDSRPDEKRPGDSRLGETRPNESSPNANKPPIPPLASDDSSRKNL